MAVFPVEPTSDMPTGLATTASDPEIAAQRHDRSFLFKMLPRILLLLLLPAGASFFALKQLLGLPDMPRCWAIARAGESASNQIYCAEILASKQTADDLSRAIQLIKAIEPTDSFRKKADRLIEQWTTAILALANAEYQAGSLAKARDIAQQVPFNVSTAELADEKIKRWEAEWAGAEDIYAQTQTHIDEERWYDALTTARKLLQIDNRYWATQKYQELMRTLQSARENKALAKKAAVQNQPATIDDLISRWEKEQQQNDLAHVQKANELAKAGDLESLRAAIAEAELVIYGTPRYDEAQQLISGLRQRAETMEDQPRLDRAVALASRGDLNSLEAAIDEVNQVTWGRALYDEARDRADTWRNQAHELRVQAQEQELRTLTGQNSLTNPSLPAALPSSRPLLVPPLATPNSLPSPAIPVPTGDRPTPGNSASEPITIP